MTHHNCFFWGGRGGRDKRVGEGGSVVMSNEKGRGEGKPKSHFWTQFGKVFPERGWSYQEILSRIASRFGFLAF